MKIVGTRSGFALDTLEIVRTKEVVESCAFMKDCNSKTTIKLSYMTSA